jgi:hypothetical protein
MIKPGRSLSSCCCRSYEARIRHPEVQQWLTLFPDRCRVSKMLLQAIPPCNWNWVKTFVRNNGVRQPVPHGRKQIDAHGRGLRLALRVGGST